MGLRDWLKKTRDEFDQAAYYFELGCEVLGEPHSNSLQERSARIAAGKREDARRKEARQRRFGRAAIRAYQQARQMDAQVGRDIQYEDDDCKITIKNGYQWKGDKYTTDVIVADRHDLDGGHWHVVFDADGHVLHEEWSTKRHR